MSATSYQCLSCRLKDTIRNSSQHVRRQFHASSPVSRPRRTSRLGRKDPSQLLKPAFPSVKEAEENILEARERQVEQLANRLRPYTERERKLLALRYTPEQMAAIEAGEAAIDPKDMIRHGRIRGDAFRPQYIDDFATMRPLVDDSASGRPQSPPLQKFDAKGEAEDGEKKLNIPGGISSQQTEEEDPHMIRLQKQTGMTKAEISKLRVRNLVSHRVVNQTRMGKIQSLYYLTIAGNGDGAVGIGEGKAAEDEDGRRQAMMNAIRNMKPIPRYEGRTIYGDVQGKVGATVVQLSSRPPGFGNRCQHLIFELTRAAGISDLAARTPRSRNKMNVVKAAFQALTSQRLPEDVALSRGRKMVDVRGVYYGGQVY